MNQELVPWVNQENSLGDGMLFVRTRVILTRMIRIPIIAAAFIVLAVVMPIQNSFASNHKQLDFIIYPDGSTHVLYEMEVDPLKPDHVVDLFGTTIDNFFVEDENGFFLSANVVDNTATIDTLGASKITLEYDIHDLVSKNGKIWSFKIDAPTDYDLTMPKNTVIVGMSTFPSSLQTIDDQSKLSLSSGPAEINYFFSLSGSEATARNAIDETMNLINEINNRGIATPLALAKINGAELAFTDGRFQDSENLANEAKILAIQEQENGKSISETNFDYSVVIVAAAVIAAGIVASIVVKRSKRNHQNQQLKPLQDNQVKKVLTKIPDKETIFNLKPELREDDKELVTFLIENGGQAYESELRKKFLQPRTTMWRAVKRLEREEIVEIEKKDLQNLVKLKENLGGEDE